MEAMVGPRFGFPLVHAAVRVVGGESNPAKDADVAFAQAAGQALREAMDEATIDLLEPVMAFEITAPSEFMSGIIAELNSCRAEISDVLADSPILNRIDPVYRYYREHRGEYFIEPVEGGRRVYEEAGERHRSPTLSTHLTHALAVAMILAGLGGFFVSRRW